MSRALRAWVSIAILAILPGALLSASGARAEGIGTIEGRVVNGSEGSGAPVDMPVTIHVFRDRAKVGERIVRTAADGSFVVAGLDVGPEYVYFPVVDYGSASYAPERPITLDDASQKSVEVRIFEPTSSDDGIHLDRSNLLVLRVQPTALTIMEMSAVMNRFDRTYVGAGDSTLRFALPKGAVNVTPMAGLSPDHLSATNDGFVTTTPILPGRHELAFSYELPFDAATLQIAKRQEHPTATFNLYLPDTGLTAVSPQLRFQGTSEFGGQRYQLYSAQGLGRGELISLRLEGLPAPWGPRQLGLIVLGSSAAVLAGAVLIAIRRRLSVPTAPLVASHVSAEAPNDERLRLVRAIAELDERYTAGQVDGHRYRAERERDKAHLVTLIDASSQIR